MITNPQFRPQTLDLNRKPLNSCLLILIGSSVGGWGCQAPASFADVSARLCEFMGNQCGVRGKACRVRGD